MHRKPSLVASPVRGPALGVLAINAPERSPLLPKVPTLQEAGMAPFDRYTGFGMFAPARTPEAFVERLRSDAARWGEVIKAANVQVR